MLLKRGSSHKILSVENDWPAPECISPYILASHTSAWTGKVVMILIISFYWQHLEINECTMCILFHQNPSKLCYVLLLSLKYSI